MSNKRIPEFRYRSSLIFGDDNWHTVAELSQLDLSEENPNTFYVGDTFIQPIYGAATKIKSDWLWRFNFVSVSNSGSSYTRFYGTSTGSNGSTSIVDLNVGITSTSNYYPVGDGNFVEEAYKTEMSNGVVTREIISTIRFGSYTSWYFTPTQTTSTNPTQANRAIVCKFKSTYEADLPSDLYTISGNTVTWNTTHPIYILLYGKKCIPY